MTDFNSVVSGGLRSPVRRQKTALDPARLYSANLGLVGVCLRRFPFLTGDAREDAYGAALLGLWVAAQRFDPARGFTFGTFAGDYIRGYILSRLRTERRQTRLDCVSLETPIGNEDGGELLDLIADTQAEKPGQWAVDRAGVEALLAPLSERQQYVLRARYLEDKPLREIAEAMDITYQRCYQIEVQAVASLRKKRRQQKQETQQAREMLHYASKKRQKRLEQEHLLA